MTTEQEIQFTEADVESLKASMGSGVLLTGPNNTVPVYELYSRAIHELQRPSIIGNYEPENEQFRVVVDTYAQRPLTSKRKQDRLATAMRTYSDVYDVSQDVKPKHGFYAVMWAAFVPRDQITPFIQDVLEALDELPGQREQEFEDLGDKLKQLTRGLEGSNGSS